MGAGVVRGACVDTRRCRAGAVAMLPAAEAVQLPAAADRLTGIGIETDLLDVRIAEARAHADRRLARVEVAAAGRVAVELLARQRQEAVRPQREALPAGQRGGAAVMLGARAAPRVDAGDILALADPGAAAPAT